MYSCMLLIRMQSIREHILGCSLLRRPLPCGVFLRITLACLFCHNVGANLGAAGAGHAAKALHTQLVVDTQNVFLTYQHNGAEAADVTFNLKDFKHMLALCEGMGANVAVRFDSPGAPLLVEPSLHGTHAQVLQANALELPTSFCM